MNTMGVIQRGMHSVMIDLAKAPSSRLVERAVRCGATLLLDLKTEQESPSLKARFAQKMEDSLLVTLDGASDLPVESAYCDATFTLDNQDYMFSTVVQDVLISAQPPALRISRPVVLHTWQRRRFIRAAVADSASVYLGEPGQFDEPAAEGRILNLSRDGIACRVNCRFADARDIGEIIGVSFTIGALPDLLKLNAVVRSKTPGGTPGSIILGLQFEDSEPNRACREQLAAALDTYL